MSKKTSFWQNYKQWIKEAFPGKPRQAIEDWDFIMVFEERYED